MAKYQALLDAPNDAAREQMIESAIDDALASTDFYEQLVEFGYDYIGSSNYGSFRGTPWKNAATLVPCETTSKHYGRFLNGHPYKNYTCDGDGGPCENDGPCKHGFTCDNALETPRCQPNSCNEDIECGADFLCNQENNACEVILSEVAPWWAPNGSVKLIGWGGEGHKTAPVSHNPEDPPQDCGVVYITPTEFLTYSTSPLDHSIKPRCGCGPDLIYCGRGTARKYAGRAGNVPGGLAHTFDGYTNDPNGRSGSIFQEPGRLFAHIVTQDKPFDDLVLGNYTVANQVLQHFYVRAARQTGRFQELDDSNWWKNITDPNAWREVVFEEMNPFYLAARDTKFDPRQDFGEPPGIPSAGVLTTYAVLGSFLRERPRAARVLENLTCRQFAPPPAGVAFPPYVGDPATGSTCMHCHKVIDPAAIHFKRFAMTGTSGYDQYGLQIAGITPHRWLQSWGGSIHSSLIRWMGQYMPNTVMTPATELDIELNPDARFIDFAPPGTTLFGVTGDGTIGPLGFGKMIVDSGEFDRCAVRRFYERFGGMKLDPAKHKLYIDKLVKVYSDSGKKMKPFIRWILSQSRFRKGH